MKLLGLISQSNVITHDLSFCPFRKSELFILSIASITFSIPNSLILVFSILYLFVLGLIATNLDKLNLFQASITGSNLLLLNISLDILLFVLLILVLFSSQFSEGVSRFSEGVSRFSEGVDL